eukprot:SAG22_NODE_87_length_21437_cov_14.162480_19_plen_133_part_00
MSQGFIHCWVDIFTREQARAAPVVDISAPLKQDFELRICVYRTRGMAIMDPATQMNDLFITGNLTTCDESRKLATWQLETDTHWRAAGGQGDFNWRWKWDVQLPCMDPTRLLVEAWDQDVVGVRACGSPATQ